MPANRTVASLSIALIVFVMLTFVLAITTYLFFKQRLDAEKAAREAAEATAKANADLNAAIADRQELQRILGVPEDKTIATVDAETTARFNGEFAGFDAEPKTYLKLVDWLAEALRTKDEQMDSQRVDHEQALVEKDQAIAAEKDAAARAAEEKDAVAKDAQSEKDKFDESRQAHQQQQERLTAEQKKALDSSIAFDKLRAEVAKGLDELKADPDAQKAFRAKSDPGGQLDVLFSAIRRQRAVIQRQNELLAKLRGADPAVQAAVAAATAKDDRIDGFDGRVIAVNEAERTAIVSCNSTKGLRPGLLLSVYDPKDPRPQFGSRKGLLEVIAVEGPTVARARIRRDSIHAPILGGDGVATSLWAPGESPEVVIVGYVQLDPDPEPDTKTLESLVQRAGGRVQDTVTPSTALVVDAGAPKSAAGGDGKIAGWRPIDETRRKNALRDAPPLGIRVVTLDEMLDLLGLERADLGSSRLPTRGDDGRSLPRRSVGVAY